jgi:hypothetical protein
MKKMLGNENKELYHKSIFFPRDLAFPSFKTQMLGNGNPSVILQHLNHHGFMVMVRGSFGICISFPCSDFDK